MLFGDKMNVLQRTFIGKKMPKKRFYENITLTNKMQEKFTNYIDSVIILNKFSKDTINIPKSKEVEEIFLFEIKLKSDNYISKIDELLEIIDRSIQYHALFKIVLNNKIILKISYKNRSLSDFKKYVVDKYFSKEYSSEKDFEKEFLQVSNAINMNVLYDNILKLFLIFKDEKVENLVEKQKNYDDLQKKIEELELKMIKEKQPDKQYELHKTILNLKKGLEESK
jgi:hypothetical protein